MVYGFLGIGFALLILGSETALRGSIGMSRAMGLSPLLIGLLVISIGSSAPELFVSLQAVQHHSPDIAIGNIVGSNIVNILLILGLGALIRPMPSPPKVVFRDGGTMVAASLALVCIAIGGTITRQIGLMLLAGFVAYLVLAFATDWRRPAHNSVAECRAQTHTSQTSAGVGLFLVLFGMVCLFFGAHFIVDGAVAMARTYQVPEAAIGLTVVALGTSLPELAITFIAAARGRSDIAVGQLIGANVFNILFVLGLTAALHPLVIAPMIANVDVLVMAGVAVLLIPLLATSWRLTRARGFLLILCYVGYSVFLASRLGYHLPHMPGTG
jgi:cation:H+ antiporter